MTNVMIHQQIISILDLYKDIINYIELLIKFESNDKKIWDIVVMKAVYELYDEISICGGNKKVDKDFTSLVSTIDNTIQFYSDDLIEKWSSLRDRYEELSKDGFNYWAGFWKIIISKEQEDLIKIIRDFNKEVETYSQKFLNRNREIYCFYTARQLLLGKELLL